jgi:hypothetical protein
MRRAGSAAGKDRLRRFISIREIDRPGHAINGNPTIAQPPGVYLVRVDAVDNPNL